MSRRLSLVALVAAAVLLSTFAHGEHLVSLVYMSQMGPASGRPPPAALDAGTGTFEPACPCPDCRGEAPGASGTTAYPQIDAGFKHGCGP